MSGSAETYDPEGYDPNTLFEITNARLSAYMRCYEVVRNLTSCTCVYNVPYDGGAVERKVVTMCAKCAAVKAVEES
jgi:hypothetical protein